MVMRGHPEKYELYLNDNIYYLQTCHQEKTCPGMLAWAGLNTQGF
jgi:hypothetical protein